MNTLGNDRTWKNSAIGFFLLRVSDVSWMKRNERWLGYCIVLFGGLICDWGKVVVSCEIVGEICDGWFR